MPLVLPDGAGAEHTPATALAAIASATPMTPHYLIFFASVDEKTGQSWCGDCREAQGALAAIPEQQSTLIYVGQRDEWKDANNPFRQTFKITNVPTVVRVDSASSLDDDIAAAPRLVEGEILDETKLKKFIDSA